MMSEYKILSKTKVNKLLNTEPQSKYPWKQLYVGEGFFVQKEYIGVPQRLRDQGLKFSTRSVEVDGVKGVLVIRKK